MDVDLLGKTVEEGMEHNTACVTYFSNQINIKSVVLHKNKNIFMFLVGLSLSSCALMKYPCTKTIHMISTCSCYTVRMYVFYSASVYNV